KQLGEVAGSKHNPEALPVSTGVAKELRVELSDHVEMRVRLREGQHLPLNVFDEIAKRRRLHRRPTLAIDVPSFGQLWVSGEERVGGHHQLLLGAADGALHGLVDRFISRRGEVVIARYSPGRSER